jgi:hypothetical protein
VHRLACKEGEIEPVQNMVKFILIFLRISQRNSMVNSISEFE